MEAIFCLVVGLFFAASIYLMLSSHLVRILLGVSIFGNAVNLLIFTAGRLAGPAPPVLDAADSHTPVHSAEALLSGEAAQTAASAATAAGDAHGAATSAAASLDTIAPAAHSGQTADSLASAAGAAVDALGNTANPLPQALILTAIVISFSIFAFLLVLTFRAYQAMETDNVDDMRVAEGEPVRPPLGY
ncbi:hypothetical protein DLJ53_16975 [Acuticoccus sediminis]|uniref:Multisubunit sodium/proton antiporter MrpC subunit n=1 Tax=Acuticoccus sediminis TaxID=2184697 RepID=A0A8B2NRI7_9HYPH|nr:NADH-quinone oxidoreductase subunit K [Acuticoccus sediminis]RAI00920.1 hypothetical protein DLJ53_16975 [Acuticoccus sediminis]